jgi:hypothetical protein
MKDAQLNFFTIAFDRYKLFALPYITAALFFNKDAVVELITDNVNYFDKRKRNFLNKYFRNRVRIRAIPKKFDKWRHKKQLKSIRWLEQPEIKTPYVYTGDIDIITLVSNIHLIHLDHAKKINKPYSNLVRRNGINMTGLHFIISDPYYKRMDSKYLGSIIHKINAKKIILKSLDERILCRMMKERFGLPVGHAFRPVHGLHLCLHHTIIKWAATGVCPPAFITLDASTPWKEGMQTVFDPRFKKVIQTYKTKALPLGKEDKLLEGKILSGKCTPLELEEAKARRQAMRAIKISLR